MALSPCLHVKLQITAIGASGIVPPLHNLFDFPAQRPFPPHVQHVVIHRYCCLTFYTPFRHSVFSSLQESEPLESGSQGFGSSPDPTRVARTYFRPPGLYLILVRLRPQIKPC